MKLFGTDGIRGTVNQHPITPETVLKVGMAIGRLLYKRHSKNMIIIGKDTRLSGYLLESALTSGICSMGMNVTLVGPIPTPAVAFLARTLRFDAGIVISASHNPYQDNGIKIFMANGFKLPDRIEAEIEAMVANQNSPINRPTGSKIGKAYRLEDATARYLEYVKSTIPREVSFDGLKVVVDSAHGAAYKVTPTLLVELGARVISINDKPDGKNINAKCGSLFVERLGEVVLKHNAHVGIAHDGDADRTLLCDDKGKIVDGDLIMALWAKELKKQGKLKHDTVVATVMSNLGLEHHLLQRDIRLIRTQVGDRYVVERMLEGDYTLGGEQSGHVVCLSHNTTGDGPITAVQILHILKQSMQPLSELVSNIKLYPQVLKNITVTNKKDIDACPEIVDCIKAAQERLKDTGRILVRPSGTEPKIRVMVEGMDNKLVKEIAVTVADVVSKAMA
ncbi:phosphoglucosamine mutase [Candidatus Magnetobacterium casense]|uniref:Phosphoglucosamine mutase n=1 Tax=Candidatus Magnetobacterium casense TaxID=1455061 RepID=A0ABS6S2N8_9BACT|nr:phosphoglucosamine mutase [Candidatus Magnetobacterium casensis]MBV6342669.1 phosphoglucosamine mutase [Candidatus Magnetobacterium casensis]